jgi:hypothetical protein
MKIVQTFCSFNQDVLRSKFGWYAAYYHLVSWSLSAHSLSRFYDVTLYTDENGYNALIRKLRLPYSNVIISHDTMHKYHKSAWALAKLKTFAQQSEPFLHVDGDVFIGKPFDSALLQAGVIVQNLEMSSDKYERNLNRAKDHLRYLPLIMHADIKEGDICSCNAGIIGGSDLALLHELSRLAFAIADKNDISRLHRNTLLNINVLLEQVMLSRLLLQQDKRASTLFREVFYDFGYTTDNVARFGAPYVHLVGGHKRSKKMCMEMENVLAEKYPEALSRMSATAVTKRTNVFSVSA